MSDEHPRGVVVYLRRTGDVDAIDEYSRRLVDAVNMNGGALRYLPDGVPTSVERTGSPTWIVLQYQAFSYGRFGFAPRVLLDTRRLLAQPDTRLAVMVHEAWVEMVDWRSTVMGIWQRGQLRALMRLADAVMTSTQALAREMGVGAIHLPVATNITPIVASTEQARRRLGVSDRFVVTLFGRGHPSRALDHSESAIIALAEAHGAEALAVLNLGADAPTLRLPATLDVRNPGLLSPHDLSLHLWASDLVLLPFTDGVSTRRTTLMAALAHGRAVLALRGPATDDVLRRATDALSLIPVGDTAAFSRAAVELSLEPDRLRALGDSGRRLYATRFDWPLLAQRMSDVLGAVQSKDAAHAA